MKRKILAVCLTVCLAVIAIAGASLAYFTDNDSDVNIMTVGNVKIDQLENGKSEAGFNPEGELMLLPGEEPLDKAVTVKNIGTTSAYVRTLFALEDTWNAADLINLGIADGLTIDFPNEAETTDRLQFKATNNETGEITVFTVGCCDYEGMLLEAGNTTPVSLESVALDAAAEDDWSDKVGASYEVLVLSQAVQSRSFDSADEAFDATFGTLTADLDETVAEWFAAVLGDGYTVEAFDYDMYDWENGEIRLPQ